MTEPTINRNKVTESPMDIIQELLMCPAELMQWLTIGAIELFALGADADSAEPDVFTDAMPLIADTSRAAPAPYGLHTKRAGPALRVQ